MKKKTDTEGASDQSSRIVELEQKLEMAGKELHSAKESVAAAKAEGAASAQEELKSSQTECESWKRKAEAAEDLAKKLQAAGGGGSDGGGGAVIAELSAEKEKLQESVEKLKKNGELVMSKLKETNQDAKKSKDAMEKMKKQREKVRRKDSRVRVCLSSIPVVLVTGISSGEASNGRAERPSRENCGQGQGDRRERGKNQKDDGNVQGHEDKTCRGHGCAETEARRLIAVGQ